MKLIYCAAFAAALFSAATSALAAEGPASVVPSAGATFTFTYTTSVATPKGKQSGSGTIVLTHTQGRSVLLTVTSADAKTKKSIPLVVNVDGTVSFDGSAPAPSASAAPDAAARTFMSEMTLAAKVGIAARKSAGASSYTVPIALTPAGDGTPVSTQIVMSGAASSEGATYSGSAQGETTTKLPSGGNLDPKELAKTAGAGAIAHHLFGPAGRIATVAVMHHERMAEKKALNGAVPDALKLNATVHIGSGRVRDISGTQDDVVTIAKKTATIVSTWTFTNVTTP